MLSDTDLCHHIASLGHKELVLDSRKVKDLVWRKCTTYLHHYTDVILSVMASKITSLAIIYSTVYSGADQRKHQSSASLAFARGIRRSPVTSPHEGQWRGKVSIWWCHLSLKMKYHIMTICISLKINTNQFCWTAIPEKRTICINYITQGRTLMMMELLLLYWYLYC